MIYYENKKDVKRQVYVDTLNTFNGILLTRMNVFKISTSEKEWGEINNISTFIFTLSFEHSVTWFPLVLIHKRFFWNSCFVLCLIFLWRLTQSLGHEMDTLLTLVIFASWIQLSASYKIWKVGFLKDYNSPAVMDTTYSSLHLLILPIFTGCQQQALHWEKKASCCPPEAYGPNSGACFTKHLASASPNSEPSLYADNGMLDAEFSLQ